MPHAIMLHVSEPQRIAKFLSAAGVCSRRDAEKRITEGRVTVNGITLTTPAFLVSAQDIITMDGKKLSLSTRSVRLWRYHKPRGLITSHRDEHGRDTVFDQLPNAMPRVVSVGRLDVNSEGLLLLTTSGALARAMELPKNALARSYRVRMYGTPQEETLHALRRGITIKGVHYAPLDVTVENKESGRNRWIHVTLREGKNREIRRIFEHFGHEVSRLIRTQYGPFSLGNLAVGAVAEIAPSEVIAVQQQLTEYHA